VPEDQHAGRNIRWANEAIVALASLAIADRRILIERLELVAQFPAMYPARQRGHFKGLRYFVVGRRWIVYYQAEETIVSVVTVVPAKARPK
jgi:plasmid stabilization system protein ParE